jgi:hypothetical protein
MGEQAPLDGCDTCNYPGNPARNILNDGHFVTVTYELPCGNGVVDSIGSYVEECDGGGCWGPTTCRLDDGTCDDGNSCTLDSCATETGGAGSARRRSRGEGITEDDCAERASSR